MSDFHDRSRELEMKMCFMKEIKRYQHEGPILLDENAYYVAESKNKESSLKQLGNCDVVVDLNETIQHMEPFDTELSSLQRHTISDDFTNVKNEHGETAVAKEKSKDAKGRVKDNNKLLDSLLMEIKKQDWITPDVQQILKHNVLKLQDTNKPLYKTKVISDITKLLEQAGVNISDNIRNILKLLNIDIQSSSVNKKLKHYELINTFKKDEEVEDMQKLLSALIKTVYGDNLRKMAVQKALNRNVSGMQLKFNKEMYSFVDVCLLSGKTNAAHSMVSSSYISQKRTIGNNMNSSRGITDVTVYNKLIWAWAKEGDISRIKKLHGQMENLGLKPTLDTFAACLVCITNTTPVQASAVKRILSDMAVSGFHVEDLSQQCIYNDEIHNQIETAIRYVRPEFKLLKHKQDTSYEANLVTSLNKPIEQENPFYGVLSTSQLLERIDQQLKTESEDTISISSIGAPVAVTQKILLAREMVKKYKAAWQKDLHKAFTNYLKIMKKDAYGTYKLNIAPYFELLPAKTFVSLMMKEVEYLAQDGAAFSNEFYLLQARLGLRVYKKSLIVAKQKSGELDKVTEIYKEFLKSFNTPTLNKNHREMWYDLVESHKCQDILTSKVQPWTFSILKEIGNFLYSIILAEVKIDPHMFTKSDGEARKIPAAYSVIRYREKFVAEEIKPHPVLVELFLRASVTNINIYPEDLPSIVPPVPWCNAYYGSDVIGKTDLLKSARNIPHQMEEIKKLSDQKLFPILDAVNTVSMTPWIVNKQVLDIIINVFNSGGDDSLDIPRPSTSFSTPPQMKSDMKIEEKVKVFKERSKLLKNKQEMYSRWCTELYRLSIANMYRDEVFWFGHNLDFRGRVYAIPPYFNHIGSDLARSILKFAKGKPLGVHGLDWLKIHLVNLSGHRKRSSNAERLNYANEHITEIFDSADNPLTGSKWWRQCDEPWQALACCIEIAAAMRSPDQTDYISHFPVHQDGSCNGLQHYAALGRDVIGATSVNLCPSETPNDVYNDVVQLVEKERAIDASNGVKIAKVLEGFVARKVIKQTIMTTVYGVTRYGAKQQIYNKLNDLENFPKEHLSAATFYLTEKTFSCLEQMFTSTKQIKDWFVTCAELISCLHKPVQWQTPLGLPIVQPYFKKSTVKLLKSKKSQSIDILKPNIQKQKNAFPPNYIHSLDASHMMLTALHCLRAGITFVSVHDCYWTHACDVDVMNKICREQFVALHKQPLLENVAANQLETYGFKASDMDGDHEKVIQAKKIINIILQKVPSKGTFELNQVLNSTYFFS